MTSEDYLEDVKVPLGILSIWCAVLIAGAVMDSSFQKKIDTAGSAKASDKAARDAGRGMWISMLVLLVLFIMMAYTYDNDKNKINKNHVMAVLLFILIGVCTTAIVFSVRLGKKIGDKKVNVGMTAGMWSLYGVMCALLPLAAMKLSSDETY